MSNKLEPGDLALIIKSVKGEAVGKIVTCIEVVGVHSQYGTIWLVEAPTLLTVENGKKASVGHMPQDWLMKIPKDPLPDESDQNTLPLETTV